MNNYKKLEVGRTYKNYREVCAVLGEPVKDGKSKIAQLKEWECNFSYRKSGHSFIITEVFETVKGKVDGRVNKIVYIELIERLLLEMLSNESNNVLTISRNKLFKELKMVNSNYSDFKNRKKELCESLDITKEELEDFYTTSDDMLKRNVEKALQKLESKFLIHYNDTMFISRAETDININNIGEVAVSINTKENEYGDIINNYYIPRAKANLHHEKASTEDIKRVLEVNNEVLNSYNCRSIADVYKRNLSSVYYRKTNKLLWERYNISNFYYVYEITFTDVGVAREIKKLEKFDKINMERKLNEGVKDAVNNNLEARHNKTNKVKYSFRNSDVYLSNGKKLIDKLITKEGC